jgi:hypothetical protein
LLPVFLSASWDSCAFTSSRKNCDLNAARVQRGKTWDRGLHTRQPEDDSELDSIRGAA